MDFYFGDANFPKDKYLQKATKKGKDRWVPLATIADFKKMQVRVLVTVRMLYLIRNARSSAGVVCLNDWAKAKIQNQRSYEYSIAQHVSYNIHYAGLNYHGFMIRPALRQSSCLRVKFKS